MGARRELVRCHEQEIQALREELAAAKLEQRRLPEAPVQVASAAPTKAAAPSVMHEDAGDICPPSSSPSPQRTNEEGLVQGKLKFAFPAMASTSMPSLALGSSRCSPATPFFAAAPSDCSAKVAEVPVGFQTGSIQSPDLAAGAAAVTAYSSAARGPSAPVVASFTPADVDKHSRGAACPPLPGTPRPEKLAVPSGKAFGKMEDQAPGAASTAAAATSSAAGGGGALRRSASRDAGLPQLAMPSLGMAFTAPSSASASPDLNLFQAAGHGSVADAAPALVEPRAHCLERPTSLQQHQLQQHGDHGCDNGGRHAIPEGEHSTEKSPRGLRGRPPSQGRLQSRTAEVAERVAKLHSKALAGSAVYPLPWGPPPNFQDKVAPGEAPPPPIQQQHLPAKTSVSSLYSSISASADRLLELHQSDRGADRDRLR